MAENWDTSNLILDGKWIKLEDLTLVEASATYEAQNIGNIAVTAALLDTGETPSNNIKYKVAAPGQTFRIKQRDGYKVWLRTIGTNETGILCICQTEKE